jgi:16S rRNA (uracil1498-N3)-methyltransferase
VDLVVQKATELGATALVPLITERSEVRLDAERAAKRVAHWQGVVRAACEQCGRNRLPEVGAPRPLDAFLAEAPAAALRLLLAPDGTAPRDLPRPGAAGVVLLVGPEGGLSEAEAARAAAAGFVGASLGPRVLRTETAALAALAAVQAVWG